MYPIRSGMHGKRYFISKCIYLLCIVLIVFYTNVYIRHSMLNYFNATKGPTRLSQPKLPKKWEAGDFVVSCCDGSPFVGWAHGDVGATAFNAFRPNLQFEDAKHRKQSFEGIFETREWINFQKKDMTSIASSGYGSTEQGSRKVRETLGCVIDDIKRILNKQQVRMLDVPCGDMLWMSDFLGDRVDVVYTGVDIVSDLIDHHKNTYSGHTNWHFSADDIVQNAPSGTYDLVFCRELTQHLTSGDTMKVLEHFSNSGSHFVMLTTYPKYPNIEVNYKNGRFRPQNLEGPPYSLVPPVCSAKDGTGYNRQIALWKLPLKQRII